MNDGDPSQYLDREDVWTIDREYKPPTMIERTTDQTGRKDHPVF